MEINDLYEEYEEYSKYNASNTVEFNPYSPNYFNNTNRIFEMKINIVNSEKELYSNHQMKDNFFHYGVIFKSETKYTIFFNNYYELEEMLKGESEKVYKYDYRYYDPIQTVSLFQLLIDKAIIKTLSDSSKTSIPDIQIRKKVMDQKGYSYKSKVNNMQSYMPFLMTIYYIPCICSLLNHLVIEKETKIKQSLIIIGLKRSIFWGSWALIYTFIIVVSSSLCILFMYYFKLFVFVHWSVLIVILLIFGLSCCCISFILSTMIDKSKTGNVVSIIISILLFSGYFVEESIKNSSNIIRYTCLFTISPVSFVSFFNKIVSFEQGGRSITLFDVWMDKNLKFNFLGLCFSLFLYYTIAIYLDNVLPQGNNFHRHWYFFISDLFSHYRSSNNSSLNSINKSEISYELETKGNQFIEDDPKSLKDATVRVNNIKMTYKLNGKDKEVLKGINFNAFSNEIFAILGHNGAGKTTLINIMTGIISPSKGEIYYNNRSLVGHEIEICSEFGYCPQFDTFNNNLNVGEHIILFGGIKGLRKDEINVEAILKEIDLYEKRENFPNELSGGQRRKLNIALAFLGSPKYVFLDEPTTGLDPYSRKNIWNFLSHKKKGCTIFVTTHYMDEADFLADRKMIIYDGKIICLGSSLFLKNRFDMNYIIDIQLENLNEDILLDRIMKSYCPQSVKLKKIQRHLVTNKNISFSSSPSLYSSLSNPYPSKISDINEQSKKVQYTERKKTDTMTHNKREDTKENYIISYSLPMKYSKSFSKIFLELNRLIKDSNNSIKTFTLTAPTLEELFIKIQSNKEKENLINSSNDIINIDIDDSKLISHSNLESILKENRSTLKLSVLHQMYCIIKLRLKIFTRDKNFAFLYTFFPVCISILCIYFAKKFINSSNDLHHFRQLEISSDIYKDGQWFKDENGMAAGKTLNIINNIGMNLKNSLSLQSVNYENELTVTSNKLTPNLKYIGGFGGFGDINNDFSSPLKFNIFYNNTCNFALPIAINLISNAILSDANIQQQISVTYQPFSNYESKEEFVNDNNNILNLSKVFNKCYAEPLVMVIISITLSLTLSIYGPLMVKEREIGITHQLLLKGTKLFTYWISILISDFICIFIPVILIFATGVFSNIDIFNYQYLPYTVGITILWIISSLIYQYIFCYFFEKYEKVSFLVLLLNPIISIFIGIVIYFIFMGSNIDFLLKYTDHLEIKPTNNNKLYAFLIFYSPSFISALYSELSSHILKIDISSSNEEIQSFLSSNQVSEILNNSSISYAEKSELITEKFLKSKLPSLEDILNYDNHKFLKFIIFLIGLILIYSIILFLLERTKIKKFKNSIKNKYSDKEIKENKNSLEKGPDDVFNEYKRVKYFLEKNQRDINNETMGIRMHTPKIKNYPSIKIFELTKDFSMSAKEMGKRRRLNEKNKYEKAINETKTETETKFKSTSVFNSNENNTVISQSKIQQSNSFNKGSLFQKMDNRITYDEKKKKYIQRIVNNVTFGINNGECIGLLGPNGAGKTTIISIITGLLSYTHGTIKYDQNDLNENINNLHSLSIGYCAQYDSLWDLLTVKETIEFYLNICGYPAKKIQKIAQKLMKSCDIEMHSNKKICEISGGTKRKLSLIISICSSPNYLILDEPSAGMDPFTRRYIWKLITDLKTACKTATILTTHSTEEAEALSDRIAILIKGKLICIDSEKNIKMKYNNKYVLEVFTDYPDQFENELIKKRNIFGLTSEESYEVESSLKHQKYFVQMKTENIAKVFSIMEYTKDIGLVSQYNFGQFSLEEVFINFINNIK